MTSLLILWRAVPPGIKLALAGCLVGALMLSGAYWLGGRAERAAIERDAAESRLETRDTSERIENDVETIPDDGLRDALGRRIMRPEND